MTDKVLVTGGTGFVAGWCIVELLKQGYDVRTTVRDLGKSQGVLDAVATEVDPRGRVEFVVADLLADKGWDTAMAGCAYVLHVASPLGGGASDALLIQTAREGALKVLGAAVKAGVKRVVMTSSTAACGSSLSLKESLNDETRWTDVDDPTINGYRRSKALAERAAWDFMAAQGGTTELVTVLPTAIFGPVLKVGGDLGSLGFIKALAEGRMPGAPKLGFCVVDVRDLSRLHVIAMTAPQAAGERFIAGGDFMWFIDICRTLRARLGDRASKAPTRELPNTVVRLLAKAQPGLKSVVPNLGKAHKFSSEKAKRVLGWESRPAVDTVTDTAEKLLPA